MGLLVVTGVFKMIF
ncbi:hypothetical protein [Enterobacter hormaechei]